MKTSRPKPSAAPAAAGTLAAVRLRLAEAEATLRAIQSGEVDTLAGAGRRGGRVFTLAGAEHAYRVLIESMNEGALTLTTDRVILYANACFARMVKLPLEQVIGSSFRRFLSREDRALLRPHMHQTPHSGSKLQLHLKAGDTTRVPVQISVRELVAAASDRVIIGMVVTDMTEVRRTEELLRALTHRVVQVQEAERGRVAVELHDNITQMFCAVLFSSQALADKLTAKERPAKREAIKLRKLLIRTAEAVERIGRSLRPSALEHLGLPAVLRDASQEFAKRTGLTVTVDCGPPIPRMPGDTELAFYRVFQEIMKNVERHAQARKVSVSLRRRGDQLELTIFDDGVGFDAIRHEARRKGKEVLGLLGMHERAAVVGGVLTVKSGPGAGTEIVMRVPLPPMSAAPTRSAELQPAL